MNFQKHSLPYLIQRPLFQAPMESVNLAPKTPWTLLFSSVKES